jgi:hypothetical protein
MWLAAGFNKLPPKLEATEACRVSNCYIPTQKRHMISFRITVCTTSKYSWVKVVFMDVH